MKNQFDEAQNLGSFQTAFEDLQKVNGHESLIYNHLMFPGKNDVTQDDISLTLWYKIILVRISL